MAQDYGSSAYSTFHQGHGTDSAADFARLSQVIGSNVQKIQQNVAQIQRMTNQLGSAQETEQLWEKLSQIQHYTNQLAKDTNRYVKDIAKLSQPTAQSEQRARKIQVESLTKDFSDALSNFQAAQRRVAEKERASVAKARTGMQMASFDDRASTQSDDQLINFAKQQAQAEAIDLDVLQDRENAIRQLEADIQDVNVIFKDLGMMVHEQGEVVDSIEANVERATVHVEEGTQSLRKASELQSKSRKKALIIVLILIAICIVFALIIWAALR